MRVPLANRVKPENPAADLLGGFDRGTRAARCEDSSGLLILEVIGLLLL